MEKRLTKLHVILAITLLFTPLVLIITTGEVRSYIYNNTLSNNSNIQNNTLISYSSIQSNTLSDSSYISYNTLNSSSYIQNTILSSSYIQNNTLSSSSYIQSNTLNSNSYIQSNTLINSIIHNNTLINDSILQFSGGDVVSKTLARLTMEGNNTSIPITATIIFNQNISKTIFKREDGTSRLQYVNNSDNVVITNVDA